MDEGNITVQVEDNSPQTEQTLRPIMFVSWFLSVARLRKYPEAITIILHIIHFGVCSVIVGYGAKDFFGTFGEVFKSDIFKIMYCMNKMTCYVSASYYIYHGIKQYNKWPELIEKIENLDQIIKRKMESLVHDRLIKSIEMLAILITFACRSLSLIIHIVYYYFVYYYFTHPELIYASDLLLYYTIAQSLNSFVFDIIIYVLYHRFRTINELILQLTNKEFSASWITLKILYIRKLHTGICDLVIMVNEIYGFHLLLCSINCFTMVVATFCRICMDFIKQNYAFMLINNIIWILYAMQFGLMCWLCTLMCQESDKTGKVIHMIVLNCKALIIGKLNDTINQPRSLEVSPENQNGEQNPNRSSNYNSNDDNLLKNLDQECLTIRNEVNDFSIQLQQHRVAITAWNFFEINNALLKSFIGAITTYLAILIQLYPNLPKYLNANYNSTRDAE